MFGAFIPSIFASGQFEQYRRNHVGGNWRQRNSGPHDVGEYFKHWPGIRLVCLQYFALLDQPFRSDSALSQEIAKSIAV